MSPSVVNLAALLRSAALVLAAALAATGQGQVRWSLIREIGDDSQLRQVPSQSESGYRKLLPSIARLVSNGVQSGNAVLIDPTGLYLAHLASIRGPEMEARFWNGTIGHLRLISQDNTTQLALLRSDYVPPGAKVVSSPAHELDPGTPLVVILEQGAVRARIESSDKLAIIQPSNRLLPATEIRFETP